MQAALSFGESGPSARPRIFASFNSTGARGATDRQEAVGHERIDDDVVLSGVIEQIIEGPVGQWIDLDQAVLVVPRNPRRVRASRSLVAAHSGNPGFVVLQGPVQWFDFAHLAAQRWIAFVQLLAELGVLFCHGAGWVDVDDGDAVVRFDGVAGSDRLGEVIARIEEERVDPRNVISHDDRQHGVGHRAGHGGPVSERLGDPVQNFCGRGVRTIEALSGVFCQCLQLRGRMGRPQEARPLLSVRDPFSIMLTLPFASLGDGEGFGHPVSLGRTPPTPDRCDESPDSGMHVGDLRHTEGPLQWVRPNVWASTCHPHVTTQRIQKNEGVHMWETLLWIAAVIIGIFGVLKLIRGEILIGIGIIVLALLIGPGGVSILS